MFKIGDFSKIGRVSIQTLRHYDRLGLLQPAQVDAFTGYRYYGLDQLPRLNRILALKDLGLSLEEIGQLLDADLSAEEIRGMLRLKQSELAGQVREAQARLARVEARLRLIEQEGRMPDYEVILKTVEPIRVAEVQDVSPTMDEIGPVCQRIFGEVAAYVGQSEGVQFAGPGLMLYYFGENPTEETDLHIGAAFPIAGTLTETARVQAHDLPAATMACAVHHGSFDSIQAAYTAVATWIRDNGYNIVGPSREVYLQFDMGGDTSNNVTEIQFPVAKA